MEPLIGKYYDLKCRALSKFIKKYWKMNKKNLIRNGVDLEDCFTFIQLLRKDTERLKDSNSNKQLTNIYSDLFTLLFSLLKQFKWTDLSPEFLKVGEILYKEQPTIITFNYDDFIERSIEHASGKSRSKINTSMMFPTDITPKIRKKVIRNSEWCWNRPLGYGIKFNNVMLYDASSGVSREKYFDGSEYYSHNKLYSWSVLKLHGSLNWWYFSEFSPNPFITKKEINRRYNLNRNKIIIQERDVIPGDPPFTLPEQLFIDPIIITPELYKTYYFPTFIYNNIFQILWDKAKQGLSNCESLVTIGYSFHPTDFRTKKLFLESFSINDNLKELIVVNPDKGVAEKIAGLCHFKVDKSIQYDSLEDFVRSI
jgi:hypothetical protein